MSNHTRKNLLSKPAKPYPTFPLFSHATNRWAKKIRGKLHYFGPWSDPDGALKRYLDQADDLHAGRTPRAHNEDKTLRHLANVFLTAKENLVNSDELTARSFYDYRNTCKNVLETLGPSRVVSDLRAEDFEKLRTELTKRLGPVSLGNEIQRIRVLFKFACDADLIDRPIKYGPHFKRPSKRTLRLARQAKGLRMLEAAELRQILEEAKQPLRAMIYLGINAGLGASDISGLPVAAIDLAGGFLNYPRPKTGVARRVPLWPETVSAIKEAIAHRQSPLDPSHKSLVFITKQGRPWVRMTPNGKPIDAVCPRFSLLLSKVGAKRPGLGFYALRHTTETIGSAAGDQIALNHIMGHVDDSMAATYRERIDDERLLVVTNHIHAWLFGKAKPR